MQVICWPFYSLNRAVGRFENPGWGYNLLPGFYRVKWSAKIWGVGWRLSPCPFVPTALLKDNLAIFLGDHKVMHTSLPIHRSANIWDNFSFSRFVRSYRSLSQIIMQDASITSNCIIYFSCKKREKLFNITLRRQIEPSHAWSRIFWLFWKIWS